jgi:hypothetical protein
MCHGNSGLKEETGLTGFSGLEDYARPLACSFPDQRPVFFHGGAAWSDEIL